MTEELSALQRMHTWDLVQFPTCITSVDCRRAYQTKTRADSNVERHKARLVANGFIQEYMINSKETFAPIAKMTIGRSLIAIAAINQ